MAHACPRRVTNACAAPGSGWALSVISLGSVPASACPLLPAGVGGRYVLAVQTSGLLRELWQRRSSSLCGGDGGSLFLFLFWVVFGGFFCVMDKCG